ncbi:MAG: hypothetical protein FWH55_07695 [Oscillospiraceae bacterium]|nr:hypothetical protein [Oscillospiraceae bacterium]
MDQNHESEVDQNWIRTTNQKWIRSTDQNWIRIGSEARIRIGSEPRIRSGSELNQKHGSDVDQKWIRTAAMPIFFDHKRYSTSRQRFILIPLSRGMKGIILLFDKQTLFDKPDSSTMSSIGSFIFKAFFAISLAFFFFVFHNACASSCWALARMRSNSWNAGDAATLWYAVIASLNSGTVM